MTQAMADGFTAEPSSRKKPADERKGFISGEEPFACHPKMGRYADLHNHLFGMIDLAYDYDRKESVKRSHLSM